MFLHGTGQTREAWFGTACTLADRGWQAITMDLRGHGDSDWSPDGVYDTDRMTGDVAAVVEALGPVGSVVLVGASLGGRSAFVATGERLVHSVRRLVVVESAPRVEDGGARRIGAFLLAHLDGFDSLDDVAAAIADYRQEPVRPASASSLARVVCQRADGRWYWHWDPRVMWRDGQPVEHRHDEDVRRSHAAARRLDLPVLVVRGERSDLVSRAAAQEFIALAPDATLVEVPGTGHMVAGMANDEFETAIVAFIGAAPASGNRVY